MLRTNPGPYGRGKRSTLTIMLILLAALVVVWGFAIAYSFKLEGLVNAACEAFNNVASNAKKIAAGKMDALVGVNYGIKSILIVVIAVVTALVCDVVCTLCAKKDPKVSLGKRILHNIVYNYSYISAVIFALTLPVYTSYYVVVVGTVFATVVVKNLFGGFGKNIFNPAIMARIFVGLAFSSQMTPDAILTNSSMLKYLADGANNGLVAGATVTTAFNNASSWLATSYEGTSSIIHGAIFENFTLVDLAFGNYLGAMGETFTVVIFVLGIVLSILGVINWRTPAFYLGTVSVTALVIALVLGLENPIVYVAYHLCLGGLMFGAIFMITDPVTGPTSPFGKCFIGVFAGLMTMIIRIKGGYPEGVMYSIALANFISPAIDYLVKGKSNKGLFKKGLTIGLTGVLTVLLCTVVAFKVNGGKEVYAINNIDTVQYNTLTSAVKLDEGYSYKDSEYTVKVTEKTSDDYPGVVNLIPDKGFQQITGLVCTNYDTLGLKAHYDVVDSSDVKVGDAYLVKGSINVITEGAYSTPVTCYGLVVIDNATNKLMGAGQVTLSGTNAGYALGEDQLGEYKDSVENDNVGYKAGSTYSTNLIRYIVAAAYAEYNAK